MRGCAGSRARVATAGGRPGEGAREGAARAGDGTAAFPRPHRRGGGQEVRAPAELPQRWGVGLFSKGRFSHTFVFFFFFFSRQSAIKGKLQELGAYVGKLFCCLPNRIWSMQLIRF